MSFYQYWGKSDGEGGFHLLVYHSLDVAAVGAVYMENDGALLRRFANQVGASEQSVVAWLTWLLALHDIGKFYDGFQDLRPDIVERLQGPRRQKPYTTRHDSCGHHLWQLDLGRRLAHIPGLDMRLNGDKVREDDIPLILEPWVRAVTGHHGAPPRTERRPSLPREGVVADVASFLEATFALWHPSQLSLVSEASHEDILGKPAWLVSGFAVMCDWLGSNRQFFDYRSDRIGLGEYWEIALGNAEKVIPWAGVLPCQAPVQTGMARLFPSMDPSPLQKLADTIPVSSSPTLIIVEELTGAGKTEAALTLAQRMIAAGAGDGVYFALPTMATANAMHERIESIAGRFFAPDAAPSLVLVHSFSRLQNVLKHESPGDREYAPKESTASIMTSAWLADNRKKALLASMGVGTIDQALLGILPARHSTLRLLGLHRKVLVVDEVHAYDAYTGSLLERLLLFHGAFGGSAILLSATLPAAVRQRLIQAFGDGVGDATDFDAQTSYPLVTVCRDHAVEQMPVETRRGSARRVEVEMVESDEAVLDLLTAVAHSGQCACWVRNSVNDAIEAYDRLCRLVDPDSVTLFHARFILADRLAIENRVLGHFGKESTSHQRAGRIVVATQVVEQSLDLDFDEMVSDLAPIDLLVQRAGRLRRHGRRENGDPAPDGDERTGGAVLTLRIPPWTEQPDAGWVLQGLRRSGYVYPDHGRLWLTAHTLRRLGGIRLPQDARELIESVYGPEAVSAIPEGLEGRTDRAWAQGRGDASLAHLNALELRDGYCATPQHWLDDARTPTRLGEISTTLRLAEVEARRIVPIASEPWAWFMSQVDVADYLVHDRPRDDAVLEGLIERAETAMHDKGKWSLTFPVRRAGETWVGVASDREGRSQSVTYCNRRGLRISKGGSM